MTEAQGNSAESAEVTQRGRPRARALPEWLRVDVARGEAHLSERAQQDHCYEVQAMGVLFAEMAARGDTEENEFSWLLVSPQRGAREGRRRILRRTLLAELGRITDDGLLVEAARLLCERKPKTREGVQWIRRLRVEGKQKHGDADQLADELIRTANDFLARYPETSDEDLLGAIEVLRATVEGRRSSNARPSA